MKRFIDYTDIFIEAPCYLGYLWMAGGFCKKYLETSKRKELLFVVFSFIGWLGLNIVNRRYPFLHIFLMLLNQILFMGLVLWLFEADKEKNFLASSMIMLVLLLAESFCGSFFSCLALFWRHTIKNIPEPFLNDLESGLIGCIGYCAAILAVYWMSKHLTSVFSGKRRK